MITQLSHVFYFCCYKCWTATGEARKNHLGILWSKDQQRQSSLTLGKCAFDTVDGSEILHQLILSHYLQGFTYIHIYIYQLVVWDFWTINTFQTQMNTFSTYPCQLPFPPITPVVQIRASGGCCQCTEGTKRDGRSDFWSYLQTKAQEWVVLPFFWERYGKTKSSKNDSKKCRLFVGLVWDVLCSWAFFFVRVGWGGGLDIQCFHGSMESLLLPHLQWDLYKTVEKDKKLRRRYAGVGDITMWYDVLENYGDLLQGLLEKKTENWHGTWK